MNDDFIYTEKKKKSNSKLLIISIIVILIILTIVFFVLPNTKNNQIGDTNDSNTNTDANINQEDSNLENIDEEEINEDENTQTIDFKDLYVTQVDSNNQNLILELDKVVDSEKIYDFNTINTKIFVDENKFNEEFAMGSLTAMFLGPIFGTLNKNISNKTYQAYKDSNNLSFAEMYSSYSDFNIDVNEDITKEQFFNLNIKLFTNTILDSNKEVIISFKNKLKDLFDSNMNIRNINYQLFYKFEDQKYKIAEYKYIENEDKLHLIVCNIDLNCLNLYDQNKEWVNLDEYINKHFQNT